MDNTVITTIEEKKAKFSGWIKIAALGVVGLVVAPVILTAIGGLIGLAVAAGVGFVLIQLAPWFALKVANYKYRLIDAEKVSHIKEVVSAAEQNPIETMTAALLAKNAAWKVFERATTNAVTARLNFTTKVEKFKLKWPHRAKEFEDALERMSGMVEKKKVALADAKQSLDDGELKLEEMKAYYEMSKDLIEANKAAGMDTGDAFEKLKVDTACDAVFAQMNQAFAELEIAAALDVESVDKAPQPAAQLGHSESVTLEVPVLQVRSTQKVSR